MYDRILLRMRDCIRRAQYVMTVHAEEEMVNDNFALDDVEHGFISGSIVERQRDKAKGEWKYLVRGSTIKERRIGMVAKIGPTGKLVIITVYAV